MHCTWNVYVLFMWRITIVYELCPNSIHLFVLHMCSILYCIYTECVSIHIKCICTVDVFCGVLCELYNVLFVYYVHTLYFPPLFVLHRFSKAGKTEALDPCQREQH